MNVRDAIVRLQRDGRANVFGLATCFGFVNSSRLSHGLSRIAQVSPNLLPFFLGIKPHDYLSKLELNTAHLLLQHSPQSRALVRAFLQYYIEYPSARAICESKPNDQAVWNLMGVTRSMPPVNTCRQHHSGSHKDFFAVISQLASGNYTTSAVGPP